MSSYINLVRFLTSESSIEESVVEAKNLLNKFFASDSTLTSAFKDAKELENAIKTYTSDPELHQKIYVDGVLLDFFENGVMEQPAFAEAIRSIDIYNSWVSKRISTHVAEAYSQVFDTKFQLHDVRELNKLYVFAFPSIDTDFQRDFKKHAQSFKTQFRNSATPEKFMQTSFMKKLDLIPSDTSQVKSMYAEMLQNWGANQYLRLDLKKASQHPEKIKHGKAIKKALSISHQISGNTDAKAMSQDVSKRLRAIESSAQNSGIILWSILGLIVAASIIGGILYMTSKSTSASEKYEEEYREYEKKMKNFKENRTLSKQQIEQRRKASIISTEHYSEYDNVPLFHAYIQTNKHFSINEIDDEMYELSKVINKDNFDTDKVYVEAKFFTTDQDKPYREVLGRYTKTSSSRLKYKQVTLPQATRGFRVENNDNDPYTLDIERKLFFTDGSIFVFPVQLHVFPSENKVEVYELNPMPSLSMTLTLDEMMDDASVGTEEAYILIAYRSYHFLKGELMRYRIPIVTVDKNYGAQYPSISGDYNWELTTSDKLAFVRIRAEEISGYQLINREAKRVEQAQLKLPKREDTQEEIFVQYVSGVE